MIHFDRFGLLWVQPEAARCSDEQGQSPWPNSGPCQARPSGCPSTSGSHLPMRPVTTRLRCDRPGTTSTIRCGPYPPGYDSSEQPKQATPVRRRMSSPPVPDPPFIPRSKQRSRLCRADVKLDRRKPAHAATRLMQIQAGVPKEGGPN